MHSADNPDNPDGLAATDPEGSRRVELDGPSNFRDLGGLPVADGTTTRFAVVYRADRLCTLSDADLRRLEARGVRHVFDLRSAPETAEFPDRLPEGSSYVALPMTSDETPQARTVYERIVAGEVTAYGEADMVAGYLRILTNYGASFVRVVSQLAHGEPMIVHCTAGKDRTGLAAMLMLDLAGVAADDIVADYALSQHRRPSPQHDFTEAKALVPTLEDLGLDPAKFSALWQARPAVMAATLQALVDRWGGAAGYLVDAGADADDVAAARAVLRAS